MALTGPQFKQIHEALLDAFPTQNAFDLLVQDALHRNRERITTTSGLDAIAQDLLVYCEAGGSVAALVCAAYNRNPSNPLLSRIVAQASAWPELSSAGLVLIDGTAYVFAPRHVELTYLSALIERYDFWTEKFTPLAGIAEVTAGDGDAMAERTPVRQIKVIAAIFCPKASAARRTGRSVNRNPVSDRICVFWLDHVRVFPDSIDNARH